MPEDAPNRIIENVVNETLPKTIRMQVSVEQFEIGSSSDQPSLRLEETYLETSRGERYFDRRSIEPSRQDHRLTSYCDGAKCANLTYAVDDPNRQERAIIGRDFMHESKFGYRDAPTPYRFYHVGLRPLHEALADAERVGQERVIERTCNNFHFRKAGGAARKQSLVYSLDDATSVPLKIAAYADPEQIPDNVPNWIWEATTLDVISGRHYPKASKYRSFRVSKTNTGRWTSKPALSKTIQVSEISFDEPIPKSTFWPVFQPGVLVMDSIAKQKYQVPGGPPPTPKSASVGTPIRVAPETGSWLPNVGLVLSIALLCAAAVIWRRSR